MAGSRQSPLLQPTKLFFVFVVLSGFYVANMPLQNASACSLRLSLARSVPGRRFKSKSTIPLYHPKVRALPFALSPKEATENPNLPDFLDALLTIDRIFTRQMKFRQLFQGKSFNLMPNEVMAAYLPSWFVDAELRCETDSYKGPRGPLMLTTKQSFTPGHSNEPLCRLSMRTLQERQVISQAVRFTSDMGVQHGTKIQCLPYTFTPFSATRAFGENPSGLRMVVHWAAVYPILVPVYIAKYSFPFAFQQLSLLGVIEAASRESRISYFSPSISGIYEQFISENSGFTARQPGLFDFEEPLKHFERLVNATLQKTPVLRLYEKYEKQHQSTPNIDFEDARIREWTEKEITDVAKYVKAREMFGEMQSTLGKAELQEALSAAQSMRPKWLKRWQQETLWKDPLSDMAS